MKRLLMVAMLVQGVFVEVVSGMEQQKQVENKNNTCPIISKIKLGSVTSDQGKRYAMLTFQVAYGSMPYDICQKAELLGIDDKKKFLYLSVFNSTVQVNYESNAILNLPIINIVPDKNRFNVISSDEIKKYVDDLEMKKRYAPIGQVVYGDIHTDEQKNMVCDVRFEIQYNQEENVLVSTKATLVGTAANKKLLVFKIYDSYFTKKHEPRTSWIVDAFVDGDHELTKVDIANSLSRDDLTRYLRCDYDKIKPDRVEVIGFDKDPRKFRVKVTYSGKSLELEMNVLAVYATQPRYTSCDLWATCSFDQKVVPVRLENALVNEEMRKKLDAIMPFPAIKDYKQHSVFFDKTTILNMIKKEPKK